MRWILVAPLGGSGAITFATSYGSLNGGGETATVPESLVLLSAAPVITDAAGTATVTVSSLGTVGTAHLTATGPAATTAPFTVEVVAPAPTLSIKSIVPNRISAAGAPSPLATSTVVTFSVVDYTTNPVSGAPIAVAEQAGEGLVTFLASVTTGAAGTATLTVSSAAGAGTAHLTATGPGGTPLSFTVTVLGVPSSIFTTSGTALLGLRGSGIQEQGSTTFLVTDASGTPVPGATVAIAQAAPQLVTLTSTSAVTDANGKAVVAYTAGPEVGVTSSPPRSPRHHHRDDARRGSVRRRQPQRGVRSEGAVRRSGRSLHRLGSGYHGPNGVWDADTVIWKPAWVVFTDSGTATTAPTSGAAPASDFSFACADYADADFTTAQGSSHFVTISAGVYAYDHWLNVPSVGTKFAMGTMSVSQVSAKSFGFDNALESWGSMGMLGLDFDWVRVAASDPTKACDIVNDQACIEQLRFHNFSDGAAGFIVATNSVKKPVPGVPAGTPPLASTKGYGCNDEGSAIGADQYGSAGFFVPVELTSPTGVKSVTYLSGRFARGTGQ